MIENIFTQNTEVPDIVQTKVEDALARIKREEKNHMAEKKIREIPNRNGMFKRGSAAAVCAGILTAFSITAVAAAGFYWSRGMQGAIRATGEQQQSLTEQGVATILAQPEDDTVQSLAVTDAGITIRPMETIVDESFAYLSFSVEGFELGEGEEPGFERVGQYLGDDPKAEGSRLNMNGSFYDDGRSYVMKVYSPDRDMSLVGKTIHVSFENLGIASKAACENKVTGRWDFTIPLSGQNAAKTYPVGKQVGDTIFTIEDIELSPISVKVNYSVDGTPQIREDELGIPHFRGVVYKDGTKQPYLANGGEWGYEDETLSNAFERMSFHQVIDVEQVQSLLFQAEGTEELVEIILP